MEGHVATTSDLAVLLQGGGWVLKTADHFTTADVQYTGEGDITFAAIELESRASGAGLTNNIYIYRIETRYDDCLASSDHAMLYHAGILRLHSTFHSLC